MRSLQFKGVKEKHGIYIRNVSNDCRWVTLTTHRNIRNGKVQKEINKMLLLDEVSWDRHQNKEHAIFGSCIKQ
jgi:hypothetical protein